MNRPGKISVALMIMAFTVSISLASSLQQNKGAHQHDHAKPNQNIAPSALKSEDLKFMLEAGEGGVAEVELGKLAVQRGSSEAVKEFGQRMIDDHSKAFEELNQFASKKGMQLPQKGVDAKAQVTIDKLSKLSGAEFDKAYMDEMVKDHKKDVAEFERASKSLTDPDLKAWVNKTLPTLKDHLNMAQTTNAGLMGKNRTGKDPNVRATHKEKK
jgi:putative membrane protein